MTFCKQTCTFKRTGTVFSAWCLSYHCHKTLLCTPPHLSNTQTHTLICISFPFALSTKTCLTRKALQHGEQMILKAGEWERMESHTGLCFCFHLFSPSLMCAVVDHVECTSIWWKVASASCCVPFLKEKLVFWGVVGGFHLRTQPQVLPSCVAPSTHIVLTLLIQSSCL